MSKAATLTLNQLGTARAQQLRQRQLLSLVDLYTQFGFNHDTPEASWPMVVQITKIQNKTIRELLRAKFKHIREQLQIYKRSNEYIGGFARNIRQQFRDLQTRVSSELQELESEREARLRGTRINVHMNTRKPRKSTKRKLQGKK